MNYNCFIRFLAIFFLVSSLLSCDTKRVYEKNTEIKNGLWNYLEKFKFDDIIINDTISTYNVYINLRNSVDYRYRNLYLFIDIKLPNNKITRDTVECTIADETGKWLGKGIGKIKDCQISFLRNIRFPFSGCYTFIFEQGMRDDMLEGITDIGLRIERNK